MLIKLSEIPVVCLTLKKNEERHERIKKICGELGIENLKFDYGEITQPYTVGIAQQHLRVLTENRLKQVLILEDDCDILSIKTEFGIPPGVDALYLGHSHYGMIRGKSQYRGCISSWVYSDYIRPYNMLGMHSIFYPSYCVGYKDMVIFELTKFIENPVGGCDEAIAMKMKNKLVYCLPQSIFYQNDGHSNEETSRPLEPYF